MLRSRVRFILIYLVVLAAILSAVVFVQIRTFTRLFQVRLTDIVAPISPQTLTDGAVTFLLLGIGGTGHEGPTLTDSITLVRYSPIDGSVHTLGIPRDLWNPEIQDKVNATYTYALQQNKVTPTQYVKAKYSDLLKVQIDHVMIINFADFEELIDLIGGVDVLIEKGFVDTQYPKDGFADVECEPYDPNYGCRYETLVFRAGLQKLSGKVALKYVRSRHADGEEGSDFSRSSRQQNVLTSIRNRIEELVRRRDFDTLTIVASFLNNRIKRDISNKESIALARSLLLRSNKVRLTTQTLPESAFEVPPLTQYDGRYVLVPKDDDFAQFQSLIHSKLNVQMKPDRSE